MRGVGVSKKFLDYTPFVLYTPHNDTVINFLDYTPFVLYTPITTL
jgi:hypothetical protein